MQISKRFIRRITCTIGLLFLLAPLTVLAQTKTKVVVIPLGDDVVKVNPLKNVITVAKANGNFSDPVAAINSITDASAANPYLVVIGPGVYTITQTLQMKSYVDIVGSGENVTKLTGAVSGNTLTQSAIIAGANHSALSSVTVEHAGGSSFSLSVYNNTASPTISNVTATASGGASNCAVCNESSSPSLINVTAIASGSGGSYNRGVYNVSSSPTMLNVTATASGGDGSYGVQNYSSSPTMTNVTATASGGSTWTFGVDNEQSSSPTMTGVTAIASSGAGWVFGVDNSDSSSPTMTNVTATASGPASLSYGVYNFSSSAAIRRSTMKGNTYSIKTDQTPVTVSQSTLIGAVSGGVNNECVACDNGSGTALGANCQ